MRQDFSVSLSQYFRVHAGSEIGLHAVGVVSLGLAQNAPLCTPNVSMQFVGSKMRPLIDEPRNHGRQTGNAVVCYLSRPHRTVAFNGDQHSLFFRPLDSFVDNTVLIARFAADILSI